MQRVGVARALAADPPLILMDEPFGALDPITRQELQEEFLELESEIKKTVIFVTHDILEAIKMGDRIALMDCGRLHQLATPADLTANPADELVEKFLGPYRFQLALLASTVKSLLSELGLVENSQAILSEVHLKPQQSLLEALELFKKSGLESIGVYDGATRVGTLSKRQLLKQIMVVLGGTE
jgi:osmoprotectant transport system ATP-binding protein